MLEVVTATRLVAKIGSKKYAGLGPARREVVRMKNICKRIGAVAITAALTASIGVSALAYSTLDFTDVPAGSWAYEPVMKMADAGVIKGTGGTSFSPEMKLSAAMFLTLVGRAVYENDVKPTAEDNWFSAYVRAAQEKGLLAGTAITTENAEGEITRYDMAVILAHVTTDILKAPSKETDASKIADYGDIPTKYAAAVAQVYAQGLITGDGAGSFNGAAIMRRDEAATVLDRLITLRDATGQQPTTPTEPEESEEPEIPPRTGETIDLSFSGGVMLIDDLTGKVSGINISFCTLDGRVLGTTVSQDGEYVMETSIDMADYSYDGDIYIMKATYTAPDGTKYTNIPLDEHGVHKFNLYQTYASGWHITLYNDPAMYDLDF